MPCNDCVHIQNHNECRKHGASICDWMPVCKDFEQKPEPYFKPTITHMSTQCLGELVAEMKIFLTLEMIDRGWDFEEDVKPLLDNLDQWVRLRRQPPRTMQDIEDDVQYAKDELVKCLEREKVKRRGDA